MTRALAAASLAVLMPHSARAEGAFNAQRFEPVGGASGLPGVITAEIPEPWTGTVSLWIDFALKPLRLEVPERDLPDADVVARRLDGHMIASLTVHRLVQTGVVMPMVLYQGGRDNPFAQHVVGFDGLSSPTVGDLGVWAKVRALGEGPLWPALAAFLEVRAPTGNAGALAGEPGASVKLITAASRKHGRTFFAVNLGYRLRTKPAQVAGRSLGDELLASAAAAYRFADTQGGAETVAFVELAGHTAAAKPFSSDDDRLFGNGLEMRIGARGPAKFQIGPMTVAGALALGLVRGFGTPMLRFLLNMDWASQEPVRDGDGDRVPDTRDQCPTEREDWNGFEDIDGCPDAEFVEYERSDDDEPCADGAKCAERPRRKSRVTVEVDLLVPYQPIRFQNGRSAPTRQSEPVLDAIARFLLLHRNFEQLQVQVYATKPTRQSRKMATARARRVVEELVKRGVTARRLRASRGKKTAKGKAGRVEIRAARYANP